MHYQALHSVGSDNYFCYEYIRGCKLLNIKRSFRVFLRKQSNLMPITDYLIGNTLRMYNGADIRVMRLIYGLEQTKDLNFPVAECGVGSGYSMAYMLSYLRRSKDDRNYHGFDTFEGFPYIHEEDLKDLPEKRKSISVVGHYKEFVLDGHLRTIKRLRMTERATLHKGLFDETVPMLPHDQKFSFVFMDCDLYQSYKSCLSVMYDRVVSGGIIIFDEYEHTVDWPGAKKAIDEFLEDKPEKPEKIPFGTSWMIRKIG